MASIGIIGATGNAGSALYKEAIKRGHDVTAIVRNAEKAKELLGEEAKIIVEDAFNLTKESLNGFDVIIDAFATAPGQAYLHVDLAAKLIALFRETVSPRLVFILGAGSLVTGEDNHLLVEDIRKDPLSEAWISIPENQLKELEFLRNVENVNWVGVSPGVIFQKGEAKPYLLGEDRLLVNDNGESVTSSGTIAAAILDEIEQPKHRQGRFTVIDK